MEAKKMNKAAPVSLLNKYRSHLMGFSALWILFFHVWQHLFSEGDGILYLAEMAVWRLGFHGVDIFMLLSGLGLSYAIEKYSTGEFLLRRFKRIAVPVLALALIRAVSEKWSIGLFLSVIFGVNFYTGKQPYFFLWFITAIETLYLLFPLFWKTFTKSHRKKRFMLVFFLLWYIGALLLKGRVHSGVYGLINRIPVFALGACLGWCDRQKPITVEKRSALIAAIALSGIGCVLSLLLSFGFINTTLPNSNSCVPGVMIALGLSYLLVLVFQVLDKWRRGNSYIARALCFTGEISLELYCVQEFINQLMCSADVLSGIPAICFNLIEFAVILLCAFLLHLASDGIWRIHKT